MAIVVHDGLGPTAPVERQVDGLDLTDFFRLLWRARFFLIVSLVAGTLAGGLIAVSSPDQYVAKMLVQTAGQQGGMGGALGQIGNLMGLQAAAEDREFSQFQAILTSVALAERLQEKHRLMQEVFKDSWDPVNQRWKQPTGWQASISGALNEWRGRPRWSAPSVYDLAEELKKIKVKNSKIGLSVYEITYAAATRDEAIKVLQLACSEAEAAMLEERKIRVAAQSKYLKGRIETTAMVEYRLALIQLLSDQEKILMLLDSNLPYANIVLDPPTAPVRPQGSSVALFGFIGAAGGLVIGAMLLLIYRLMRSAR